MMNRKSRILRYLKTHKYITSYQAFELFNITRLSAVIFDLRQDGHKIGGIWETITDETTGNPVRFLRYFLIKGE